MSLGNGIPKMQSSTRDILKMTCDLFVGDTAVGCLRYAHLSVQEYLDSRPEFIDNECHRGLAERCLESFMTYYLGKDLLSKYAVFYWPQHYARLSSPLRCEVLHSSLLRFGDFLCERSMGRILSLSKQMTSLIELGHLMDYTTAKPIF